MVVDLQCAQGSPLMLGKDFRLGFDFDGFILRQGSHYVALAGLELAT